MSVQYDPRTMTEAQLQNAVIKTAKLLNWQVAHFRPAQNRSGKWSTPVQADGAGFPDLIMAREGRLLAVELKAKGGKPSARQIAWLELLATVPGVEADVWDVDDWNRGHVEAQLR